MTQTRPRRRPLTHQEKLALQERKQRRREKMEESRELAKGPIDLTFCLLVMLHKMTHLPVVVDPSHACGHAWMVPELAKAAVAAGADGLMIEVHNNPAKAKCDGAQSLTPDQFDELMQFIGKEVEFFGKKMN